MEKTTISVKKDTKTWLEMLGRKGESYDDIIRRFLDISREEIELLEEVYRRMERTPREEYVSLEEI